LKTWVGLIAGLGLSLASFLTSAAGQESRGADWAGRLGCWACHSREGQGGNQASRLDGIGSRLSPGDLQKILTYPRQLHPGAKMPSYAYLPPHEHQALLDFLGSLK
jgi:cbb3-type cytochrome oxidase cytochrome c subunit